MPKISKMLFGLVIAILVFNCCGAELAEAATNDSVLAGGFGLSSIDNDLRRLLKGITSLARPVVTIMTALAGMMVVLNIGGDHKQKIWNWILGIGLALNFGSVLWHMWGGYADIPTGRIAAAEYTFKVFGDSSLTDGTIDTLSQMMKYFLTIIVAGALAIKPIAVKLLLGLALADMSIRLALDLTDKDKVSWLVKTFLKIGFYVFLIQNWLGIDGWNLMDMLSKGFQEIGFVAGNYGEAPLVSTGDISGTIDPKHNLAPDSIVNNMFKMFSMLYGSSLPQDASFLDKAVSAGRRYFSLVTSPISSTLMAISLLVAVICAFLTAIEMFMARIEFYVLALLSIPLLAFGVIKHFEHLAQNAIRAVFNCGIKVCVISFLQAIICQMFTRYTNEIDKSLRAGPLTSATGTHFELLSMTLQLLLMSIIMFLIVSKVPKLIQGLLSGNPSLGGSDMTGAVMGTVGTAASAVGTVAGARAAAVAAKAQAVPGGASNWRMSTMGQLGAAILAKAPVTGSAYGAYSAVQNMGWNNTRQNQQSNESPIPPKPSTQEQDPQQSNANDKGTNGGGTGGNTQPGGGDAKTVNQQTSAPPPVSASSAQYSPTQQNTRLASSSDSSGSTWKGSPSSSGTNSSANNTFPSNNQASSVNGSSSKSVPAATSVPVSKDTNTQNTPGVWRRRSGNSVPPKEPPKV